MGPIATCSVGDGLPISPVKIWASSGKGVPPAYPGPVWYRWASDSSLEIRKSESYPKDGGGQYDDDTARMG